MDIDLPNSTSVFSGTAKYVPNTNEIIVDRKWGVVRIKNPFDLDDAFENIFYSDAVPVNVYIKNGFVVRIETAKFGNGINAIGSYYDNFQRNVISKFMDIKLKPKWEMDYERLISDEKIRLRLTSMVYSQTLMVIKYEIVLMDLMAKIVDKIADTRIISELCEDCIKSGAVPFSVLRRQGVEICNTVKPYTFYKVCEMALRYNLNTLDKFVYEKPCFPYAKNVSLYGYGNRKSINDIRRYYKEKCELLLEEYIKFI